MTHSQERRRQTRPERSDSLRIALLSPGWPRARFANGIVSAVADLSGDLRALGADVQVLTIEGGPEAGESDVVALPRATPRNPLSRLTRGVAWRLAPEAAQRRDMAGRIIGALAQLARTRAVDVIEMEESFGWAGEVAQRVDLPVVTALHGPWFLHGPLTDGSAGIGGFDSDARIRAERESLARASALLAPANDVLVRSLAHYGLSHDCAAVIPYAIRPRAEAERWRASECRPGEILFVGRFDRHKGGDIVLRAFARVAREHPHARLVFVGPDRGLVDGDGRRWTLPEYVAAHLPRDVAEARLEITGQLAPDRIGALRRRAALTVSASRYENLSVAALEALAVGSPLIVADQGGLPEHVEDGRNGLVFRAGEAEGLASRIGTLLADPARAAELAANGLAHVIEALDPRRTAQRRLAFYTDVVARHRGSRAP